MHFDCLEKLMIAMFGYGLKYVCNNSIFALLF